MPYVATINVPGYLPMDDEPPVFDTIEDAWGYLAEEREREEYDACDGTCDDGPACTWHPDNDFSETLAELRSADGVGVVYGDTPGYHGDHDLGLVYSVDVAESESD